MQEAICQSGGGFLKEGSSQYMAPDDMSEGDKDELYCSEGMRKFLEVILPRSASRS